MKSKLIALVLMLLSCTAGAAVSSRNVASEIQKTNRTTSTNQRNTVQNTSARVVASGDNSRTQDSTRTVSSRGTAQRATTSRDASTRNINSRTATTNTTRTTTSRAANSNVVSRTAVPVATTARTATNQNIVTRVATNTVANRAAKTHKTTNKNQNQTTTRTATRTASGTARARTTATSLLDTLTNKAELIEICRNQYADCMDNYCNVLDEDMGRCACSKNIKNYQKTSDALKEANNALTDVAQQIQYIGLNKVQIETLFAETEAEMAMSGSNDNTKLKTSLDKIKNMVIDVKSSTASSTENKAKTLDLSGLLDFKSDGTFGDIMSLFQSSDSDINSISNQRGETLRNTAHARCKKTVLDACTAQGIDSVLITNGYDIQVDKDCIAYEQNLNAQNEEMLATVRNATNVLQRARLTVAANKNSYDLRGCIAALETCMTDEYICGADYEHCLDESGEYIVAGEVVMGSEIGTFDREEIETMLKRKMFGAKTNEIQYSKDNNETFFGPCAEPLNLCQDYTYSNKKIIPDNRVISEYISRAVPRIKKKHDDVIAEFASECVSDVVECVSANNYSKDGISSTAISACKKIIGTCKSAAGIASADNEWVLCLIKPESDGCDSLDYAESGDNNSTEKYTLTYSLNGGAGNAPSSKKCSAGKSCALDSGATTLFNRAGYVFKGWSTNSSATSGSTNITINSDTTVYAIWQACAAGTYKDSSEYANTSCTAASAGYYVSGTAATSQTQCGNNKYTDTTGQTSCQTCPSDTVANSNHTGCESTGGGDSGGSETPNCSAGQYLNGNSCTSCPAGYRCQNNNKYECTGNTYSTGGASSCTECGTGTSANETNTGCESTGGGDSGGSETTNCSDGQYLNGNSCESCPAGYRCQNNNKYQCAGNTYSTGGASLCVLCNNGTVDTNHTTCVTLALYTCAAGNYLPAKATECAKCPAGSFCEGVTNTTALLLKDQGITTCNEALSESYYRHLDMRSDAGAVSVDQCYFELPAGKTLSDPDEHEDGLGTYYEITYCADGMISNSSIVHYGKADDYLGYNCTSCAGDTYASEDHTTCEKCPSSQSGYEVYADYLSQVIGGYNCRYVYDNVPFANGSGTVDNISCAHEEVNGEEKFVCYVYIPDDSPDNLHCADGYRFVGGEIDIDLVSMSDILNRKDICVLDAITCSAGTYLPAGATQCATCPAGSYCEGGQTEPVSCKQAVAGRGNQYAELAVNMTSNTTDLNNLPSSIDDCYFELAAEQTVSECGSGYCIEECDNGQTTGSYQVYFDEIDDFVRYHCTSCEGTMYSSTKTGKCEPCPPVPSSMNEWKDYLASIDGGDDCSYIYNNIPMKDSNGKQIGYINNVDCWYDDTDAELNWFCTANPEYATCNDGSYTLDTDAETIEEIQMKSLVTDSGFCTKEETALSCDNGFYLAGSTCEPCPDSHPNSDGGTGDKSTCFRTCTSDDIENATAVTDGVVYYYGNKTCTATACEANYYINNINQQYCTSCPTAYPSSDNNNSGIAGCYRECKISDIYDFANVESVSGKRFYGSNQCQIASCATGFEISTDGSECVPDCGDGFSLSSDGSKCVPDCAANQYLSDDTCLDCPEGYTSNGGTGITSCGIACETLFEQQPDLFGDHVATVTGNAFLISSNKPNILSCEVTCETNFKYSGYICEPDCAANQYWSDGTCHNCPTGFTSEQGSTGITSCKITCADLKILNPSLFEGWTGKITGDASAIDADGNAILYCETTSCDAGYYFSYGKCNKCPDGYTSTTGSNEGHSSCWKACSVDDISGMGTYGATAVDTNDKRYYGISAYETCKITACDTDDGYTLAYNDTLGRSVCQTVCPAGQYGTTENTCQPCPEGYQDAPFGVRSINACHHKCDSTDISNAKTFTVNSYYAYYYGSPSLSCKVVSCEDGYTLTDNKCVQN